MCCLWSSTNMFQIEIRFEFFLRVLAVGLFISCASSRYLRKYSWYVATFSPTRRKYYCVPSPNQSTRINRSERPLNVPLQDINLQTEIYRQTWAHISAPATVLKLLYWEIHVWPTSGKSYPELLWNFSCTGHWANFLEQYSAFGIENGVAEDGVPHRYRGRGFPQFRDNLDFMWKNVYVGVLEIARWVFSVRFSFLNGNSKLQLSREWLIFMQSKPVQ